MHKFLSIYFILLTAAVSAAASELPIWNVCDYGAVGDGDTLNTQAIQKAIDACAEAGGGTVYIPAGVFKAGTLSLRSYITLYLEPNAVLLQSKDMNDYPVVSKSCYAPITSSDRVFLHGDRVRHVSITGTGTIDGNFAFNNKGRGPLSVLFENSSDILMQDVTAIRSPGWSITFFGCKTVDIIRVKCLHSYADGINPVCCQDVLYDGVLIDSSGDDAITIKNESREGYPPDCGYLSENIVISNTTVRNTSHPAFKIGTGTAGVFRNIVINNCIFENTGSMFTIELMRLNKKNVPERYIESVLFSNIILRNTQRMFDITAMDVSQPIIRKLMVNNVIVDSLQRPSLIHGKADAPINDIVISNVQLINRHDSPGYWLDVRHVNGLTLNNLDLDFAGGIDTMLTCQHSQELKLNHVVAKGLTGKGPAIKLHQVQGTSFVNCPAPQTDIFVQATGNQTCGISFLGADMRKSKRPLVASKDVSRESIWPIADNVMYNNLSLSSKIKSNEQIQGQVTISNKGMPGFIWAGLTVDGQDDQGQWLWLDQGEIQSTELVSSRYYEPKTLQVDVGSLEQDVLVQVTPPAFEYDKTMEVVAPATAGELTKVTVSVKNIGGTKGTEMVTLSANGKVVTSRDVTLEPGEQTKVTLEHRFTTSEARILKVGDLPDWPFATFTNNEAYFYQSDGQIVMDAGGDTSKNFGFKKGHYSAIYRKDVEGDFVVTVFLVSQEQTNPDALAGLILRNDIADPAGSAGLALLHIRPKYGGYTHWALDLDGEGQVDTDASIVASCGGYPLWFKIEKRGNTFTGYTTNDPSIWYIASQAQKFPEGCDEGVCQMPFADSVQDVGIFANAFNTKNELSRVVFSDFSLVKPVPNEALQFRDLSVSPETVGPRETFTIKATVSNTGSTAGPAKVGLYVNDHEPMTQWIELKPGESRVVEFVDNPLHLKDAIGFKEVDPDYIYGSHKVAIGDLPSQTLTVVK